MKQRALKIWKRAVASVLSAAMIFTGVGAPPRDVYADASYTNKQIFCTWLRASGVDVPNDVSSHDYDLLYANLTTSTAFMTDNSLTSDLNSLIEESGTSGIIKISNKNLRTGMREWVKDLYLSSKSALPSSLGLEKSYKYTEEYSAVSRYYADSYDFVTPSNGYDSSQSGHDRITGIQTIDLSKPQWLGINLSSGTLAEDKSVSIANALKLFEYDDSTAFIADAKSIQQNESAGYFSKMDPAVTDHPDSHFPGTKHVHIGNSLTGSGCYSKTVYHTHVEDCFEESYAMIASSTVTVYRTIAGNGYQLDFTSDTASFPFMRIYTSTSGNYNNYYKTYDGTKPTFIGNVTNVFSGDGAMDAFKEIAKRCVQVGTSTTYKYDIEWKALYAEFSEYFAQAGYTAILCPAYSKSQLATCGKTEGVTVTGYELGCGLESGKYYDDALHEVFDTASSVVVSAELVHPMQKVTNGYAVDTRVKFTFLDGHTETVNAEGSKKLAYFAVESTYDPSAPKTGRVYPYRVTASAKYGQTALEAASAGMTSRTFTLLVSERKVFNASDDEEKEEESTGRNEEAAGAEGHKHVDACYPGLRHKHTAACRTNVVYHSHSTDTCSYNWSGDTDDLKVYMTLVGSTVTVIYYSSLAMYKIGFSINSDTGHMEAGSSNNVVDLTAFAEWDSAYKSLTGQDLTDIWDLYTNVFNDLNQDNVVNTDFSTFVNCIFEHHSDMADIILGLADSCQKLESKRLNDIAHDWACGKEEGVDIDSCDYLCGKNEGTYYSGDAEVSPRCSKVIIDVEVVNAVQTVRCNESISTLTKVTFLDGHIILVNKNGSDSTVKIDTDFKPDDFSHAGTPFDYHISVTGYYSAQSVWNAEPETKQYGVTVTMLAASGYTAAEKKQLILQGTDPDYSGSVIIGDDVITSEQYAAQSAVFTNDIQDDWVGEHTVTLTAKLGSSVVSDTVTVWIIPLPDNITVECTKPETECGIEPEFNVKIEYGEYGTDAFLRTRGRYRWSELREGVTMSNSFSRYGLTQNVSEVVTMSAITNKGAADGESGTDYKTAGIYSLDFISSGSKNLQTVLELPVWASCKANSSHGKYYADRCPVCRYHDEHQTTFDEYYNSLAGLTDAVRSLVDTLDASYSVTGFVKKPDGTYEGVSDRYTASFDQALEDYRENYGSLKNLLQDLNNAKENVKTAFNDADTIKDMEQILQAMEQYADSEDRDALIKKANGYSDTAVSAYEKMQLLQNQTSLITGADIKISLNALATGTLETTETTDDTTRYIVTYDGTPVKTSPAFDIVDTDINLPDDELDYIRHHLKYKIQIKKDGNWTNLEEPVRNAGTYYLKYVSLDPDYSSFKNPYVTIVIDPKEVKCPAILEDKQYDGTRYGTIKFGTITGLVYGDDVRAAANRCIYSQSGIGANLAVTLESPLTLEGKDAGNYVIHQPDTLTGNIIARELKLSFGRLEKVYDGTETITATPGALKGIVSGETVMLSEEAVELHFPDKNVVSGAALTCSLPELTGKDADNYVLILDENVKGSITAKPIAVSVKVQDKEYDGTTDAVLLLERSADFVEGDSISLPEKIYGHFITADAGQKIGLDNYDEFQINGSDARNYSVTISGMDSLYGNINAREITYTAKVEEKVYDKTTQCKVEITDITGIIDDGVRFAETEFSGAFASAHAGETIRVIVNGQLDLTGEKAGNYSFSQITNVTGCIRPAKLTAEMEGISKAFDGSTDAYVRVSNLAGVFEGDDVSLVSETVAASFESSDAGRRKKIINIQQPALTGANAADYAVDVDVPIYADIDGEAVPLLCQAEDRVYDGTNTVSVKILGLDTDLDLRPSVSEVQGTVKSADAGSGLVVDIGYVPLEGSDAGKYLAVPAEPMLVTISPKQAEYDIVSMDHVYDGTTAAEVRAENLRGIVNESDDVYFASNLLHGTLADKDVGETVFTATGTLELAGKSAENYYVRQPEGSYKVNVVKRPILVQTDNLTNVTYGKFSDDEIRRMVKVNYENIIPEENQAVLLAITPPMLKGMSSKKTGTFPIQFVEESGDATANYEFDFRANKGSYTVIPEEGTKLIEIETGIPNSEMDVTVNGNPYELETDSDGTLYVPVPEGSDDNVSITVNGKPGIPDKESGYDGDLNDKDFSDIELDPITGSQTVILGKDHEGLYWKDDTDEIHRIEGDGVKLDPDTIPDHIIITDGYDGIIEVSGKITSDDTLVEIQDGSPALVIKDAFLVVGDEPFVKVNTGTAVEVLVKDSVVDIGDNIFIESFGDTDLVVSDSTILVDNGTIIKVPDSGRVDVLIKDNSTVTVGSGTGIVGDAGVTVKDSEINVGSGSFINGGDNNSADLEVTDSTINVGAGSLIDTSGKADASINNSKVEIESGTLVNAKKPADADLTINNSSVSTGSGTITEVADGANVDLTIKDSDLSSSNGPLVNIESGGSLTLTTEGENTATVPEKTPVVNAPEGSTVTVTTPGGILDVIHTDQNGNETEDDTPVIGTSDGSTVGSINTVKPDDIFKGEFIALPDGSVAQVFPLPSETILGNDESGNYWIDEDGKKHHFTTNGIAVTPDNCPEHLVINNGFHGFIVLDHVDITSDKPFVDIEDGRPTIILNGENRVIVPDGTAGIRVQENSSVTICGSGSITTGHTKSDVIVTSSSSGIGANDGESSGEIVITGGVILGDAIGSEQSKVIIDSGAIDSIVKTENVTDSAGNKLRRVSVDAAAAVNKSNVITTKVDDKNTEFFRVFVNSRNQFVQWIPVNVSRIWAYSDTVLYWADTNTSSPALIKADAGEKPVNPDKPNNPGSTGKPGGTGKPNGSGSNSGGSWIGGGWIGGAGNTGTVQKPDKPGADEKPDEPDELFYSANLDGVSLDTIKVSDTNQWKVSMLIDTLEEASSEGMRLIDNVLYVNQHTLSFNPLLVSFDNQNFSSTMNFEKDGLYHKNLYMRNRYAGSVIAVEGLYIVVDTNAPSGNLTSNTDLVWMITEKLPNAIVYATRDAEVSVTADDALSGVDALYYKIVHKGQKATDVDWEAYTPGSKLQLKDTQKYRIYWKLTDKLGNSRTVRTNTFFIDREKPKITVTKSAKWFRVKAADFSGIKVIIVNGKKVKNGKKITKSGKYKITVKDKAGRKTVKRIVFKTH